VGALSSTAISSDARTEERIPMKAIVVTDQAAGTAGMKLAERPELPAAINDCQSAFKVDPGSACNFDPLLDVMGERPRGVAGGIVKP
jgi:hypothetical protein